MKNEQIDSHWYLLHTFYCQEVKLQELVSKAGYVCFVPMCFKEKKSANEVKKIQVPIVHNFLFIKKEGDINELSRILEQQNIPCYFHKKVNGELYEIDNQEMQEFRMFCDPSYHDNVEFAKKEEIEEKAGKPVKILRGKFKGMQGTLIRCNKKYFFVKVFFDLAVKLKISRWCCEILYK